MIKFKKNFLLKKKKNISNNICNMTVFCSCYKFIVSIGSFSIDYNINYCIKHVVTGRYILANAVRRTNLKIRKISYSSDKKYIRVGSCRYLRDIL